MDDHKNEKVEGFAAPETGTEQGTRLENNSEYIIEGLVLRNGAKQKVVINIRREQVGGLRSE